MSGGGLSFDPFKPRGLPEEPDASPHTETDEEREEIQERTAEVSQQSIDNASSTNASSTTESPNLRNKHIVAGEPKGDKASKTRSIISETEEMITKQRGRLTKCSEDLACLKVKAEASKRNKSISEEFSTRINKGINSLLDHIVELEKQLDLARSSTANEKFFDEIGLLIINIQARIQDLPDRLERERILEIFEQKIQKKFAQGKLEDTSSDITLHMSRSKYKELSFSYIIIRKGDNVRILQQFHKADKTAWYGRIISGKKGRREKGGLVGEKGKIAKGGIKTAYELMDIDSRSTSDVRSVPHDKSKPLPQGATVASEALRGKPHVQPEHIITYKKRTKTPSGGEIKVTREVLLSPRRDTDIFELLLENAWDDKTKGEVMKQMARGLQSSHEGGIVHLDVKPENYFVNYDPNRPDEIIVFLADFDTAVKPSPTDMIPTSGSLYFMAPEIAHHTAQGLEEGKKADIYSLGMSFWQIEKRETPHLNFHGSMFMPPENLKELKERGFPTKKDRTPLQRLIFKMIHPDMFKRPSIEEVLQELDRIYSSSPID